MTKDVPLNPLKLLLIGDAGTGKTSILSRLTKKEFTPTYKPTNGVTCDAYNVVVNNKAIKTNIWDIGGQKIYHYLVNSVVKEADAVLLVYDISNAATFENLTYWLDIVTQFGNPKAIVKLVGNKNDLDRVISMESVEQFAAKWGVSYIETSALHQISIKINLTPENLNNLSFSTCEFISNRMIKNPPLQNDTQPFQVILIDLQSAANWKIQCVEKSLDDPDLKYFALSYRWGELQETSVDTGVGYTAVITSFDMEDFYRLCKTIVRESDLKYMDYVWVDAICVDQTNHDKRKATIYQMSNIYEKAKYILAVPDLHLAHLKNTLTSNKDIIYGSESYRHYLYELIHGNTDQLALMDKEFLNKCGLPDDDLLTELLNTCTNDFMDGFMKHNVLDFGNSGHIVRNIPNINKKQGQDSYGNKITTYYLDDDKQGLERLHHCHQSECPFDPDHTFFPTCTEMHCTNKTQQYEEKWEQNIRKRSTAIQRSMEFMADLISDWSTRVWVISEYNIAKKKNNLKFWFIQLGEYDEDITFFKFDFMDSTFYTEIKKGVEFFNISDLNKHNPAYLIFHRTRSSQLNQQTFLEMMLKSKASKNEDRFYAISPLTEYKNTILDKAEVSKWNIDTLTSVKIKLFQLLNTKDKLNLLFVSGHRSATFIGRNLPTFATSSIDWNERTDYFLLNDISQWNFDLDRNDTITYHHSDLPYLNLKPKKYYIVGKYKPHESLANPDIWNSLPFEDSYEANVIVIIYTCSSRSQESEANATYGVRTIFPCIYLHGSFKNNIWIIIPHRFKDFGHNYIPQTIDDYNTGFNIY